MSHDTEDEMTRRRGLAKNFLAPGGGREDIARSAAHAVYLRDERIRVLEEQLGEARKEPLGRVLADHARAGLGPGFMQRALPIHGPGHVPPPGLGPTKNAWETE